MNQNCKYCYNEISRVRCFVCSKRMCLKCAIEVDKKYYCYDDFLNKVSVYFGKEHKINKKIDNMLIYIFDTINKAKRNLKW